MAYSLIATGDLIIQSPLATRPTTGSIYEQLNMADHSFINLEVPLTDAEVAMEKLICIKASPDLAPELKEMGIDIVNIANNHGMDFGYEGLAETLAVMDRVGIRHVGGGENLQASLTPACVEANGMRVAYMGVCCALATGSGATHNRPGVAPVRVFTRYMIDAVTLDETPGMSPFTETMAYQQDVDALLAAIRETAKTADLVIVAIHWGVPYGWVALSQSEIATYQQPLAHAMIDAGASAIIGHHPHVLQGVEFYKGSPILYSLGNFIFHSVLADADQKFRTMPRYDFSALQLKVNDVGALAKLEWQEANSPPRCSLIPIHLVDNGEPVWAAGDEAKLALERVERLSRGRNCLVEMTEGPDGPLILCSPQAS